MIDATRKPNGWARLPPLLVLGLALLAVVWRFLPWMPSVFYGDDLDYLLLFEDGRCATTPSEILIAACYERFRPVASGVVMGLMAIADRDITYHLAANVFLHALIATMVYVVAQRLSGGRWVVSLALAMAVALSRLATYQVTQMIGPVESITLLATIVAVCAALRADTRLEDAWRWGWVAIAAVFVAIHTHERSIVVAGWLALVFMLSPMVRGLPRMRWLALLAACVALPVFYVGYKTFVLETHFLVGTGGTHIELKASMVLDHAVQAAKSLLSYNSGPDYLVGRSVSHEWRVGWILALAFAAAWAGSIVFGLYRGIGAAGTTDESPSSRLRWLFLLLVLAGLLLAPALVTIRLEQRWLLAPFTIGMLIPAWAVGVVTRQEGRSTVAAFAVVASIASIAVDTAVMHYYDRLFFISSPRFAEMVKRDVIDRDPRSQGDVALLVSADQCNWTLFNGGFFRIYGGKARKVHCFATQEEAKSAGLPPGTRIYGLEGAQRLVDLTDRKPAAGPSERSQARIDFLNTFAQGRINDKSRVQTPTGQGVLVQPWDAVDGARQTLTVVSGFAYHFDNIVVGDEDSLRFSVGMIYPAAQSARAVVRIEVPGRGSTTIYSADLVPPAADAKPAFADVSIPLGQYAGQRVSLSFAVESPGGNPTAHWVGFAEPRVLAAKASGPG